MSAFVFPSQAHVIPESASAAAAAVGFERWDALVAETAAFAGVDCDMPARRLLAAVFGGSPYLTQSALADPETVAHIFLSGPATAFASLKTEVAAACDGSADRAEVMRNLRIFKRRAALAIAFADIAGALPLETLVAMISDTAETALDIAVAHLLRAAAPTVVPANSGYFLIAMGKLGARELNYSSDVDFIAFYDEGKAEAAGIPDPRKTFVRLTRDLVTVFESRTADGYVFRTDLRLRPDPGSTPLAMSVEAAEIYYESLGQNWERAAMIKARAVAGDLDAGNEFLKGMRPFVWRKSLDFNAIQDIHSIKRQIGAKIGTTLVVPGHNVKLGRGGIREIEFFAQTQQLIWGGRLPELRRAATLPALDALADSGHVARAAADEMQESYRFLRCVEHRLQMIDDAQTQTLPKDPEKLAHLGRFMGYAGAEDFSADMLFHFSRVEGHYSALFADAPELSSAGGNLVFTGAEDDPDTLATLRELGFTQPEAVAAGVRAWHFGRYRATRSTRARELLTELAPALLAALGRTARPDEAFRQFDAFLALQPAGVQLFALFHAHPPILDAVAELLGDAPKLAQSLGHNPALLDNLLSPEFFQAPAGADTIAADLKLRLGQATDYEDVLDVARRFAHDRDFQIGVQGLRGVIDAEAAGRHLSDLADAVLRALLPEVAAEFAKTHGEIPGSGLAVLALGRLGAREMTPTSDLDLILIYDAPMDAQSDGPRPLPTTTYFARLVQRLINAITVQTAEGTLYPVDMRLRPSGNAGPLAVSLESFVRYHAREAWTWEHQALTRARAVAGAPELCDRVSEVVRQTLCARRDPERLLADVAAMRQRLRDGHRKTSDWNVKHRPGGLVDVDFIAQYLALRHAADAPEILEGGVAGALATAAKRGYLDARTAGELLTARHFWNSLLTLLRLTTEGDVTDETLPNGLRKRLCTVAGVVDFDALKQQMETMADRTIATFTRLIDVPASEISVPKETP